MGLAQLAHDDVEGALAASDAEFLAFVDAKAQNALVAVHEIMLCLSRSSALVLVLGLGQGMGCEIWQKYPPALAALLAPPASSASALALHRSVFAKIGPLKALEEPVWDLIIRASSAGIPLEGWPSVEAPSKQPVHLPKLAPPIPSPRRDWLREHLVAFDPKSAGADPKSVGSVALRAGLFQWHDYLEESHELSQSIEGEGEGRLGDYWHAIMHRREPDDSNAKYWFRQIGKQPIWRELRLAADALLEESAVPSAAKWRTRLSPNLNWDPFAFVDLCSEARADEESELARNVRQIQLAEMSLLLEFTYATGTQGVGRGV
jgi:hypothetical protein